MADLRALRAKSSAIFLMDLSSKEVDQSAGLVNLRYHRRERFEIEAPF
jgi:hypothetical protein